MHIGRPLMMLKQYLDMRLAGAPAWKRTAVGVGAVIVCLALIAVGFLTAHYVLMGVGAVLAVAVASQGVTAVRHGRRRHQLDSGPGR